MNDRIIVSSNYDTIHIRIVLRLLVWLCFCECSGDHRELHGLTHSLPTRRASHLSCGRSVKLTHRGQGRAKKGAEVFFPWHEQSGRARSALAWCTDRKSTRLNSSH